MVRPSDNTELRPVGDLPTVWKTKLRSTLYDGFDHRFQVEHCLKNGIVGIGWCVPGLRTGSSFAKVFKTIDELDWEGWGHPAALTIDRFANQAKVGDYVWSRDTEGRYLLAKIKGDYKYDASPDAKKADVVQVRDVKWAKPLNDLDVPGGAIRAFVGTSSSFCRINDESTRRMTDFLWAELDGAKLPALNLTRAEILQKHLDPYDVEDLVYVWLQEERNYVALPRSRQRDTPAYEWTMVNRKTRRRGIVQIKTGDSPVDLDALRRAVADKRTDTFAFATSGNYLGDRRRVTEVIKPDDLVQFAQANPDLLSGRVRRWFERAGDDRV